MKSVLDAVPMRVIDPKALTLDEICASQNVGRQAVEKIRDAMLEAGQWEQVWKKTKGKLTKAYRIPGKRK